MGDAIITKAMLQISKSPNDYEAVKSAVEAAMKAAVLRDRQRIIRGIKRSTWGAGNYATHEIRQTALEIVGGSNG